MLIFCYFFTVVFCLLPSSSSASSLVFSRRFPAISGFTFSFFRAAFFVCLFFVFVLNSALNSHLFSLINLFKYKFVDLVVRFLL